MAKRQRQWARKETERLKTLLGKKCFYCGSKENLEFDLIVPPNNGDKHHKMEWSWRISFYRKQHEHGNVQLLCSRCNSKKNNQLELKNYQQIDEPF